MIDIIIDTIIEKNDIYPVVKKYHSDKRDVYHKINTGKYMDIIYGWINRGKIKSHEELEKRIAFDMKGGKLLVSRSSRHNR